MILLQLDLENISSQGLREYSLSKRKGKVEDIKYSCLSLFSILLLSYPLFSILISFYTFNLLIS